MGLSYLYTMCERSAKCYAGKKTAKAKANAVKPEQSEKEPAQKKAKQK